MATCDCSKVTINDAAWDMKEHHWNDLYFYRKTIPLFLHIPFTVGEAIDEAIGEIQQKKYTLIQPPMIIQKDGLFRGEVLIGIKQPKQGNDPKVVVFTNKTIISQVCYDPWKKLGKATKAVIESLEDRKATAVYFWYLTCPACVKEKGYKTVILVEVEDRKGK